VRGELLDAAKGAAAAAVTSRIDSLSNNLHDRAESLRNPDAAAGKVGDTAGETAGRAGETLGRATGLRRRRRAADVEDEAGPDREERGNGRVNPEQACHQAAVIVPHPGAAQPAPALAGLLASAMAQAAVACARSQELQQRTTYVLTQARTARGTSAQARRQRRASPAGRDLMQQSEHERLLARLDSMPVIEQAKGIPMAPVTLRPRAGIRPAAPGVPAQQRASAGTSP
jgi:hypothetical protein